MARVRKMFTGGNSSQGFYSLHDNIIGENRNMLYIVKGMPGGGKSSLMREIGERMEEKGYDLEYHFCPSDPTSIDALVIDKLKIGLADGTPPHGIDPVYPGVKDKIVNLAKFIDEDRLYDKKEQIIKAKINNKYAYKKAFKYLQAAGLVYRLIEEVSARYMDHRKANKEASNLIDKIFSKEGRDVPYDGFGVRAVFYAAYTPEGYVDYRDSIFKYVDKVYHIHGEIGTGGDKILDTILRLSRLKNYQVELAYNPLVPDRLESLLIRELDTIISLNKGAEKYTSYTLNLNKYLDQDKLDKEDYKMLDLLLDKGTEALEAAKENHFILEKSYRAAIDYGRIDRVKEEIYKEILTYQ